MGKASMLTMKMKVGFVLTTILLGFVDIYLCNPAHPATGGDDLSTMEPEASPGCPAPNLRFTRPRKKDATTEAPYVQFETTQIYLPEDFTTADIEIIEKTDNGDLEGVGINEADIIDDKRGKYVDVIDPYGILPDPDNIAGIHDGDGIDGSGVSTTERAQKQRNNNAGRRNKKRRYSGGRRRRIENENGSSGRSRGSGRFERHAIYRRDVLKINDHKAPLPPSAHEDDVYYVDIAELLKSEYLKGSKSSKKMKSQKMKSSSSITTSNSNDDCDGGGINSSGIKSTASGEYNSHIDSASVSGTENKLIPKQEESKDKQLQDNKFNKHSESNKDAEQDQEETASSISGRRTSDGEDGKHGEISDQQSYANETSRVQNENDQNSVAADSALAATADEDSTLLQRVKRKSGKTTGALSRPKGGGDSGSKSTSRKGDKGGYDEDGGFAPVHPDEELSEEDEKSSESTEYSQFGEVSEIKFPGEVGPLGDRRLCKIRCVKGKWVGPLCATNEEDDHGNIRFTPLYKSCHVNRIPPHLLLSYRNISVNIGWDLPHGHTLQARCKDLGLYKLLGESRVLCSNGLWAPRMPSCVPTTLLTNFSDDSPPSIRIKIGSGSGAFEPSGVLAVLPGSTIHLDCMYPRRRGTPEWTWTGWFKQYYTGWSTIPEERATKYRLTIKDIQNPDSGTYTCASPRGLTNSISIIVATSQCPQLPDPIAPLSLRLEGNKLGQRALYRCPLGYRIEGATNSTCLASGNWSSPPPTCHPVQCPPLYLEDPHLSLTELNTSAWGRAVFKCSWGFRLSGPPGLECEPTGVWSGPVPRCRAIQCPQPLVPINGRIDGTSGSSSHRRYAVGALVTFSCTEGHLLVGEASIVCTETGFWSHPPPFCKSQCPYPGDPPNGLIAPLKFHYDPGDLLSVQCRPGFVEYSPKGPAERPKCLPDGNWSGPVPQCRNYEEV